MMPANPMDYNSKDLVLDIARTERAKFYDIIDNPDNWYVQTRCEDWQVRDMVGHMIDVTEGYLAAWEMDRRGETGTPLGLGIMSERLNEHAQAFRSLPREEAIARLKSDSDQAFAIFEGLTADEWMGKTIPHPYMGPIPTCFYPSFQIIDYGIHTWDMKWGLGDKTGKLEERTAGILMPYMFIVMQYTVDEESARGVDAVIGIIVDGEWGGQWRATIRDGQFICVPADNLDDVQAIFHFKDASDFVLTTYQRFPGGETSGDPRIIDQVRHLFFRI
ncbi:MAG TPA: maleylpyruvate isomerase N-terminal domain-containing protein [Ktedonobacteraceae bacterium]|nr:maleylpyruvate isomerase N-terminal domain-containing protein [Ktedonobacteraceae bacterium]